MNEQLNRLLLALNNNIAARKQSEKLLVLGMLITGLALSYLSIVFDPLRVEIDRTRNQIANAERQIEAQQSAYQGMLEQSQDDPNRFVNERLAILAREQAQIDTEMQALAGDLVTPNQMTELLTSVLERQAGLELVSFENVEAEALREGESNAAEILTETGAVNFESVIRSEVAGQVYSHGLIIKFEGDFFSTLKYLRFLEEVTGSFFWDSIRFEQVEWPIASVTLEIHTLSTDQGFIGV